MDYADFCEWFLRQYATYKDASGRRTLEAIELWNEPDLGDLFYKPYRTRYSAEGATHYANLVVTAGTRLKTVRQQIGADDVLILAPAISDTHNVSWAPWLDAFYGVPGVTQAYDVFSWHSYWFNACRTWPPSYLPVCFDAADINRGVLSKFGISRVRFRDMAHRGELPGITKSSW